MPSTKETEEAKEKAKEERAKANLLAVEDDDSQVQIYNAYAKNSNTSQEGGSTKKGLGCGSEGSSSSSGGWKPKGMMSFVSAGGAPAAKAAIG